MPKEFSRSRRVGEQIQRELAQMIQREVKDPRVGMVTVTGVEVSKEFEHAKVYVTVLGDDQARAQTLEGLTQARGFLRRELSHRLKLRTIPNLHFVYDSATENGMRLSQLIDEAMADQPHIPHSTDE